jgi:hypothetical protein
MRTKKVLRCSVMALLLTWLHMSDVAAFEMTGAVLDSATKAPLGGAYVVAIYEETVGNMLVSVQRCRRVRGMTTGPDGKFHFPVERLDGQSPSTIRAIKPGYYTDRLGKEPDPDEWKRQTKQAYQGWEILLSKQDEQKPMLSDYTVADVHCRNASKRSDESAGIEYLRIVESEFRRYNAGSRAISDIQSLIESLEAIPK